MIEKDIHWLSGLLEGEGSFMGGSPSRPNQPVISIEMTDEDVIRRVAKLFGVVVVVPTIRKPWKQTYKASLRGRVAVDLMKILRPLMGTRRQRQIDAAVESHKIAPCFKLNKEKVREIRLRLATGHETQSSIAADYKVDRSLITGIGLGRKWSSVK